MAPGRCDDSRGRELTRARGRLLLHAVPGLLTVVVFALVLAPLSRLRRRRRPAGAPPSILWAPVPIVNIRYSARADRQTGYPSLSLVYRTYREQDRPLFDVALDRYTRIPIVGQLVPYAVFLWAALRFDVFCFFFDGGLLGETPFWKAELPLLRLAGKKIVVYPYGGDARLASRTRARGGWHAYTDVPEGSEDREEALVAERVEHSARWATAVLGFADLVDDLPRHDGLFLHVFDVESRSPTPSACGDTVRVVHAPNHRHYKGTRFLEDAVSALQAEGLPVELVLVENVPVEQALKLYEQADIVADQFLIGAYGLFAVEGMALGKPVLCYLNPRLLPYHPEWSRCPIVNANPETLQDELRALVLDRQRREALGRQGREFALEYHSLSAAGRQMDAVYRRLWTHGGALGHRQARTAAPR